MKNYHEQNKKILKEYIEKYCKEPISNVNAERLCMYYGALNAMCMDEKSEMGDHENYTMQYMTGIMLDRNTADKWTSEMENTDGTRGAHWSFEQASQLMRQRKINCDPVEFYAVLNSVYSDFGAVAKKHGVGNVEFFADIAFAWLDDKDAVPNKAAAYYEFVVKH